MNYLALLGWLLSGYACGNLPMGYLYARSKGVDIYREGSGNPGSTNALRTMGWKAGASVFLLDIMKTLVPISLVLWLNRAALTADKRALICLSCGIAVIVGHNFPVCMRFKGGKGIACTIGTLLMFDWRTAVLLLLLMLFVIIATEYVSLSSLMMTLGFFLTTLLQAAGCFWYAYSKAFYGRAIALSAVIMLLAYWMHRGNILRLVQGRENKIKVQRFFKRGGRESSR